MSHYVGFEAFPVNTSQKTILSQIRMLAYRHSDPQETPSIHAYDYDSIDFRSGCLFNSEDEACDYLDSRSGDYDWIAVRFYDVPARLLTSKKLTELRNRLTALNAELSELTTHSHFKGMTSAFISCPDCGSKLNREKLVFKRLNNCPLCGAEMRPQTALNRLNSLRNRIADTSAAITAEQNRLSSKYRNDSHIKWMVMYEVHC